MTELLWQTILLLAAAFFFGAVLACGVKRRFYYGPPARAGASPGSISASANGAPNVAQPKIEVAARPVPEGARFERALGGQPSAPAASAPSPAVVAAPSGLVVPPTTVRVETAKEPAPQPAAQPAPAAQPLAPQPEPAGIPRISVATGSGAPTKVEDGGAGPSDNLTRIDGVDSSMERRLRAQGIRLLQDLATLTSADVKGLGESLHLGGRIEREEWVGQAKILAAGGRTYYSRRVDDGVPVPEGVDPAAAVKEEATPAPVPVSEPAPAPAAQPSATEPVMEGIPFISVSRGSGAPAKVEEGGAGPSEDLTRIHGIDEGLQGRLKELGIRRLRDIAALTASDVKGLSESLGLAGRVVEEKWVAQAQILTEGGETYYSRRVGYGIPMPADADPAARVTVAQASASATPEPASAPASAAPAPAPQPVTAAAPSGADSGAPASSVSHLRSVRSEAFLGEEGARNLRPTGDGDDLKRIRGIGVLIEKKLNSLGIANYEQIANWTGADIERISRLLDFKGRIERENWIEQARILATGGQTEFSRRGG